MLLVYLIFSTMKLPKYFQLEILKRITYFKNYNLIFIVLYFLSTKRKKNQIYAIVKLMALISEFIFLKKKQKLDKIS